MAAAQQDGDPEPRDTDRVCHGDYESSFTDVDDNIHEDTILCAADYGIATGYPDDTFRPVNHVQRDQMASFIARWVEEATEQEMPADGDDFADVDPENVHREAIDKLTTAEIAFGFDADTYGPDAEVQRDQMASFIARALSYIDDGDADNASAPPVSEHDYFADVGSDNVHHAAINALAEQGVVAGYADSYDYGPDDNVRRDQMTAFLMRGFDYAAAELIIADPVSVSIETPTTDDPYTGIEQGAEIDITFTTSHECDFAFELRGTGSDDPDEWIFAHEGVTPGGENLVTVTVPEDAAVGDNDLRATCFTEDDSASVTEEAAVEVVEAATGDDA